MTMLGWRAPRTLDALRTPVRVAPALPGGKSARSSAIGPRALIESQRLGRFRILEQIGEGGMGRIYAAWDTIGGRKVALKVPANDEILRGRLKWEALVLASLDNPNVVSFFELCEVGGVVFTVMEYLDGASLRELLARAPLAERACLDMGRQIVQGLAAIHCASFVHRDLKPENVQVMSCGRAKILDLGLAARLDPPGKGAHGRWHIRGDTMPVGLSGTVPYIAPELLLGSRADHRSDIFAFGVVLHEMLTGTLPFAGRPRDDLAETGLAAIARRCLRERPEERYASAVELESALTAARG